MVKCKRVETKDKKAIEGFLKENLSKFANQFYYNPLIGKNAIVEYKLKEVMENLRAGVGFCVRSNSALEALGVITRSKWDSNILDREVGKLTLFIPLLGKETNPFLQKIYLEAERMGMDILFTRISMEQRSLLQLILAEGAILTDVLLTFYKNFNKEKLLRKASLSDKSNLIFEEGKTAHEAELRKITASAYRHSHYFNDPKIPLEKAEAIYQEWVGNSLEGFADYVIIVRSKEKIVGYITLRIKNLNEKAFGIIDLIAVEENYRGRGVGKMLVTEGIKKICNRIDSLYVGTQISNMPALRLYEGLGFKAIFSEATLHIWLRT